MANSYQLFSTVNYPLSIVDHHSRLTFDDSPFTIHKSTAMEIKLCIAAALLLLLQVKPHAQITHIKPVPLNTAVPNVALNMVFYNSPTASIADFKNKLLILDFWSTICSSCIHHFDVLDALQQQYTSSVFILPVSSLATGDNRQTVTRFITGYRQRIANGFHFASVVNDKVLDKYFPHSTIPHFVWIYKGMYVGETPAEELTPQNIQKVLSGGALKTAEKTKKEFYDITKTLASYIDDDTKNILSSSLLTSSISSLESSIGLTRNAVTGCRITAVNISALGLYKFGYMHMAYLPNNRIVNKLSLNNPFTALLNNNNSNRDSLYCYQFIANGVSDSLMFKHMQQDISAYFRIQAYTQTQKMQCLILVSADTSLLHTAGGIEGNSLYENITGERVMINEPLSVLVERLNDVLSAPVIDETGFTKNIDLHLPNNLADTAALIKSLQQEGIAVQLQQREIPILVLTNAL